jgi:uncharacterized integral membrane protein
MEYFFLEETKTRVITFFGMTLLLRFLVVYTSSVSAVVVVSRRVLCVDVAFKKLVKSLFNGEDKSI